MTCIVYLQQMGTGVPQQTTMLNWANLSERAQKIKGLNFCASQFVTEDEVKYCVAKLFSGDVKFATMVCFPFGCPASWILVHHVSPSPREHTIGGPGVDRPALGVDDEVRKACPTCRADS